jgi:hypothetical protein
MMSDDDDYARRLLYLLCSQFASSNVSFELDLRKCQRELSSFFSGDEVDKVVAFRGSPPNHAHRWTTSVKQYSYCL